MAVLQDLGGGQPGSVWFYIFIFKKWNEKIVAFV